MLALVLIIQCKLLTVKKNQRHNAAGTEVKKKIKPRVFNNLSFPDSEKLGSPPLLLLQDKWHFTCRIHCCFWTETIQNKLMATSATSSVAEEETQQSLENYVACPSSWVMDAAKWECEISDQRQESFVWCKKQHSHLPCLVGLPNCLMYFD